MDYQRLQNRADDLITRYGSPGYLRQAGVETGDDPWNKTPGEPRDYPCRVLVINYEDSEVDGTRVRREDKRALISAGDLPDVTQANSLQAGGLWYEIIRLLPLRPASVTVIYEAQVRR
jgi:hypothetical protein